MLSQHHTNQSRGPVREARRLAELKIREMSRVSSRACMENLALQRYANVGKVQNLALQPYANVGKVQTLALQPYMGQNLALQPRTNVGVAQVTEHARYVEKGKENNFAKSSRTDPAQKHRAMFDKELAFGHMSQPPAATDPYNAVTTYQGLINLNVRYLQGENIYTPYHENRVDEETLPLLADLIRVNKAGFHSTEGQPAMKIRNLSNGGMWGRSPIPHYADTYQKSYIAGIIPRKMAGRLADFLKNQPVYFEMYQIEPYRVVADTFPEAEYNLTKYRYSVRESDLERESWNYFTNRRPRTNPEELSYFEKYPRIYSLLKRECFEVLIASKEYGTGSVIDVLLQFFNNRPQAPTRPPVAINAPRAPNTASKDTSTTYIAECNIHPDQLEDFEFMFSLAPSLTPCQSIGRELVSKCVPPEEIEHYIFEKSLGVGSYGIIFQCMYKGKEPRAVKMVFVSDEKDFKIPDKWAYGIFPVTENNLR